MSKQAFNLERVVELAGSLAFEPQERRSVLDQPLGPSEDCLSSQQIVHLIESGATKESLSHLLDCPTCLENIRALPHFKKRVKPEFVDQLLGKDQKLATSAGAADEPQSLPAIFVMESRQFLVSDPKSRTLTVNCAILPIVGPERLVKIVPKSLYLDGAIVAHDGKVETKIDADQDGRIDLLKIKFESAHLSTRVRKLLVKNQRVIDMVRIHGGFEDDSEDRIVGQTRLEFEPHGSTVTSTSQETEGALLASNSD